MSLPYMVSNEDQDRKTWWCSPRSRGTASRGRGGTIDGCVLPNIGPPPQPRKGKHGQCAVNAHWIPDLSQMSSLMGTPAPKTAGI